MFFGNPSRVLILWALGGVSNLLAISRRPLSVATEHPLLLHLMKDQGIYSRRGSHTILSRDFGETWQAATWYNWRAPSLWRRNDSASQTILTFSTRRSIMRQQN
jgi:hypothetical protein